jgi:hypothetical protein
MLYLWTGYQPVAPSSSESEHQSTATTINSTSTNTQEERLAAPSLSSSQTIQKHIERCPPSWRQFIRDCLQEDAQQRPQTFQELLQRDIISQKLQILLSI